MTIKFMIGNCAILRATCSERKVFIWNGGRRFDSGVARRAMGCESGDDAFAVCVYLLQNKLTWFAARVIWGATALIHRREGMAVVSTFATTVQTRVGIPKPVYCGWVYVADLENRLMEDPSTLKLDLDEGDEELKGDPISSQDPQAHSHKTRSSRLLVGTRSFWWLPVNPRPLIAYEGSANLRKSVHVVRWETHKRFKRLPDQIMCGQKFGRKCVKLLKIWKNKNGQKRSRSSTMLEDCEGLTLSIQTTKNIQKFSKKRERNWKDLWLPAMPCKRQPGIAKANAKSKNGNEKEFKTMYACMESHDSTKQRTESSQSKIHDDPIARKGFTSMTHCNLVHKFIPMPQAMKIPDAKAAVEKEWKKLEIIPSWNLEQTKSKREVILQAHRKTRKSILLHWRTYVT